jgi:hypothetical protein
MDVLIDAIWQEGAASAGRKVGRRSHGIAALTMIRDLQPKTPAQASLKPRLVLISDDITQIRISLLAQPPDSVSTPFLIVLVLWLMFIFTTFAMSSKPNATLTIVLGICILSASGALYLIIELGLPFGGLMQVSNESLHAALPKL